VKGGKLAGLIAFRRKTRYIGFAIHAIKKPQVIKMGTFILSIFFRIGGLYFSGSSYFERD
jgi:hypothetical protein